MVALKKWLKTDVIATLKTKGYDIKNQKDFMKCFTEYKTFPKFKKNHN